MEYDQVILIGKKGFKGYNRAGWIARLKTEKELRKKICITRRSS